MSKSPKKKIKSKPSPFLDPDHEPGPASQPVWVTADGSFIHIWKMTDDHLVNAILWFQRNNGYEFPWKLESMKKNNPPAYEEMLREAKRRGLI